MSVIIEGHHKKYFIAKSIDVRNGNTLPVINYFEGENFWQTKLFSKFVRLRGRLIMLQLGRMSDIHCFVLQATLHSESFEVEFHRLVMASYFTENNFALYYGISHDCHDNTLL